MPTQPAAEPIALEAVPPLSDPTAPKPSTTMVRIGGHLIPVQGTPEMQVADAPKRLAPATSLQSRIAALQDRLARMPLGTVARRQAEVELRHLHDGNPTCAVEMQAADFIAQHEPDAYLPVREIIRTPLYAAGDRVMVTVPAFVISSGPVDGAPFYSLRIHDEHGTVFLTVPAFRLSGTGGV